MYKQTLTFKDFEGNDITKDFYFNLSKPELLKMETETPGGMQKRIEKIQNEQDMNALVKFIEELIVKSYGEKGDDGFSFIKFRNGESLGEMFRQSLAYESLFSILVNKDDNGAAFNEFLSGIMPADLMAQAKVEQAKFLEQKNR